MSESNSRFSLQFSSQSIFVLYVILTFTIYTLPAFKVRTPYLVAGILMLSFLPFAMIKNKSWMNYSILVLGTSFFVFLFNILSGIFTIAEAINEVIRNTRFFLPVLWTLYAFEYCTVKQHRHILWAFGIITGFILLRTITALEQDQWITRILAQSKSADTEQIRTYRMQNVGGFEFSYMMGIVTLISVWCSIRFRQMLIKVVGMGVSILGLYYIIQTMYTTLLLITTLGILLLLLINIKSTMTKLLLVCVYIGLAVGLAPLCLFLSGMFEGSLLAAKFIQMYNALTGAGIDALGSRPGFIALTIENWLKSPLFGGYGSTYNAHSLVFSLLETNGLFGLGCWIANIVGAMRLIEKEFVERGLDLSLFRVTLLYIIILAILNPIGYVFEVTIAVFFITPMCLEVFDIQKRSKFKYIK